MFYDICNSEFGSRWSRMYYLLIWTKGKCSAIATAFTIYHYRVYAELHFQSFLVSYNNDVFTGDLCLLLCFVLGLGLRIHLHTTVYLHWRTWYFVLMIYSIVFHSKSHIDAVRQFSLIFKLLVSSSIFNVKIYFTNVKSS